MKSILIRMTLLLLLPLMLMPGFLFAGTKKVIKEYTYQACAMDNDLSRRTTAMREVKRILFEELGAYFEGMAEVKNFQLMKGQIILMMPGIVSAEITGETWNGDTYWLRAEIVEDTDYLLKAMDKLRQDRNKMQQLEDAENEADFLLKDQQKLREELAQARDDQKQEIQQRYYQSINDLTAIEWFERANVSYSKGDDERAVDDLHKAINLSPDYAMAYSNRSDAFNNLGKYHEAIVDANKAIALNAYDAISYCNRGVIYGRHGSYDEAMADFNRAIELSANDDMVYRFNRGTIYGRLGKYDEAMADFDRAIEQNKNNIDAYINRGAVHCGLGSYNDAVADFNKAIALNPGSASAYTNRGAAYNLLGRYHEAIADFNKALDLNPYYTDGYHVLTCARSITANQKSAEPGLKKSGAD